MVAVWLWVFPAVFGMAHEPEPQASVSPHAHQGEHETQTTRGWEGSVEGTAYSEFNHHLAGLLVILIGLSELQEGAGRSILPWTRWALPAFMLIGGVVLLAWSDHEAWPIGPLTFAQTFLGQDQEMVQHKVYALLLLAIGGLELQRRKGGLEGPWWQVPLPVFALIGGAMLFLHSHGHHPLAHKIAIRHAVMGMMALIAGSSKLVSVKVGGQQAKSGALAFSSRAWWDLVWAGSLVVIGLQLLLYSE